MADYRAHVDAVGPIPHLDVAVTASGNEISPSTPISKHASRDLGQSMVSRPTSLHEEGSPISGAITPTTMPKNGKRPRVVLSEVMKYDVDHRKRLCRLEVVDLHYGRLHSLRIRSALCLTGEYGVWLPLEASME